MTAIYVDAAFPKSWDELVNLVHQRGDVLTVAAGDLRTLTGLSRLKANVRNGISRELAGRGLGHIPAEIPNNQDATVIIYKLGTPAAVVIGATQGHATVEAAAVLRSVNASRDSEIVARIREILDDAA